MCGLAGKLYFNPQKTVSHKLIETMTEAIAHRGPDSKGIWVNENIGLGHRRLAILDLSEAGHQPMCSPDRNIWITFNGEIYNFQELRKKLEEKNYVFSSNTDTEVILYLYKEYGEECLKFLRGMFAFAIWDKNLQKLFIARDRLGKKPLKYFVGADFITFASELKAILQDPEVKKEPDFQAIHHFLSYQYAPAPLTGFKNIKKLPPAHYLVWQKGEITIKKYWNLDFSKKQNLSENEWQEKILNKLEESVKLRMIADVPLGAFLSGGIDSSAIVALMAKNSSKPIKTFSIGFDYQNFDETKYAEKIAKIFNTDHHEFKVKAETIKILPNIIRHYEEPYADSSAIPSWYLSEITRQKVTVALNGDGGDENFAGYERYLIYKIFHGRPLLNLVGKISASLFLRGPRQEKALRFFSNNNYFQTICYFNEKQKEKIYTEDFKNILQQENKEFSINSQKIINTFFDTAQKTKFDLIDQLLYVDINSYLPDDLLVKMDIASMAHALETRSPFLDHEFMELTATLPSKLKINKFDKKYILKKSLENILPSEILNRKKMGFGVPIGKWFRNELKYFIYEILLSDIAIKRHLFKKEEIKKLLDNHVSGKTDQGHHIWALLCLELWMNEYFD